MCARIWDDGDDDDVESVVTVLPVAVFDVGDEFDFVVDELSSLLQLPSSAVPLLACIDTGEDEGDADGEAQINRLTGC